MFLGGVPRGVGTAELRGGDLAEPFCPHLA